MANPFAELMKLKGKIGKGKKEVLPKKGEAKGKEAETKEEPKKGKKPTFPFQKGK